MAKRLPRADVRDGPFDKELEASCGVQAWGVETGKPQANLSGPQEARGERGQGGKDLLTIAGHMIRPRAILSAVPLQRCGRTGSVDRYGMGRRDMSAHGAAGSVLFARLRGPALAFGLAGAFVGAPIDTASAQSPFEGLTGTWRGSALVQLTSGSSETLKCQAYYTPKDSGSELGLAIRCASASNKIELRAQLASAGGSVSGRWEERTYNAAGDVSGQAVEGRLTLSIIGGGFKGSMAVRTSGGSQTVNIKTEGIALQGVNINLSRG